MDKLAFKVGFIKAMADRGVTPSEFEKMFEKKAVGPAGAAGILAAPAVVGGVKDVGKAGYRVGRWGLTDLPEWVGGQAANLPSEVIGDEPLDVSLEIDRGEALVRAYLQAAADIRDKMEKLKARREHEEKIRAEKKQQRQSKSPQQLYEEITSK